MLFYVRRERAGKMDFPGMSAKYRGDRPVAIGIRRVLHAPLYLWPGEEEELGRPFVHPLMPDGFFDFGRSGWSSGS